MIAPEARMLAAVGFLGSFTTSSTLALETNTLLRDREGAASAAYVALSIAGGVTLCFAGMALARSVARGP